MAKKSLDAPAKQLPPNHLHKRAQIVEAAKSVLLRDGTAACTSRVVAEELGLNKALMHYYFASWDEVIDTAMNELLDGVVRRISAAALDATDRPPAERFTHIVSEYLAVFTDQPGLSLLWFDYWVSITRAGRVEMFGRIGEDLVPLLESLLVDPRLPDSETRARVLYSYLIGALVLSDLHSGSAAAMAGDAQWLSTVGTPARTSARRAR